MNAKLDHVITGTGDDSPLYVHTSFYYEPGVYKVVRGSALRLAGPWKRLLDVYTRLNDDITPDEGGFVASILHCVRCADRGPSPVPPPEPASDEFIICGLCDRHADLDG